MNSAYSHYPDEYCDDPVSFHVPVSYYEINVPGFLVKYDHKYRFYSPPGMIHSLLCISHRMAVIANKPHGADKIKKVKVFPIRFEHMRSQYQFKIRIRVSGFTGWKQEK